MSVLRLVSVKDTTEDANSKGALALTTKAGVATRLVTRVMKEFEDFKSGRSQNGIDDLLIEGMRAYNGVYDPQKLAAIRQFRGSEIYIRMVAQRCRAATSLLREVYLSGERPWRVEPTPDPTLSVDAMQNIGALVQSEVMQVNQEISEQQIADRISALVTLVKQANREKASRASAEATKRIDDMLVEGGFYSALEEFMWDVALFPYCILKGPFVQMKRQLQWQNKKPVVNARPVPCWARVSPFDFYWSPDAADIAQSNVIERSRVNLQGLADLYEAPGWNQEVIEKAMTSFNKDWLVTLYDTERAALERRQGDWYAGNQTSILEYTGFVLGEELLDDGVTSTITGEKLKDKSAYLAHLYVLNNELARAVVRPTVHFRHNYFVTSFVKVPGSIVGQALPDILADIGDVLNACGRSLVNNMGIASGPQVVINDDRLANTVDTDDLYPWRRWHVVSDPTRDPQAPVSFTQPQSNAAELMGVYEKFNQMADEVSLPRYLTGSERAGGAGRTASGLAMLLGNASKLLQQVAANIDNDVVQGTLDQTWELAQMTGTMQDLSSDIRVRVRGVTTAQQMETMRARQLEFLSLTGNPIDLQIIGLQGRAKVLRSVADNLGLAGEEIVPDPATLPGPPAAGGPPPGAQEGAPPGDEGGPNAQGQMPPPGAGAPGAQGAPPGGPPQGAPQGVPQGANPNPFGRAPSKSPSGPQIGAPRAALTGPVAGAGVRGGP